MGAVSAYLDLMGFAEDGWGYDMLRATGMTLAVAFCGFAAGAVFGIVAAAASFSSQRILRIVADGYSTVLRGIPDLLVIYLFYFGSSAVLSQIGALFGGHGFVSAPIFITGALAIGVVSGAYQAEVYRGAVLALPKGEIEAAKAYGMPTHLLFRRIMVPQAARFAIPGIGNVWQLVLKESALISVVGLVELMRQAQIGAGSTRKPFTFFLTAGLLYLVITFVSGLLFKTAEKRAMRGIRRAV
ncbi:octopine/nopaline transport system permease protein [Ochrobactrum intermedium]|uniref:Octopine/nopaline transport system permease protein n=4 Tax=Brucella intermedia TaxID=94625 RepID=A0ABR6AW81_9HYPH|nr:amino acid ABC transporter, permease protein, 3-TM region, His/Glu/Gln/Arg/opine family [Brucella intermedia LMG 3301]ELT48194.1 Octopine transport system permease protein occQ [Brucella intermedia M86]MBA8853733.1 octopine/nopaline transport system permease protein [Brucella intermedia]NYD80645.1 octopine/nopaline transport system permease protein [Brucella intermedia]SUA87607.1 Histidine transport system permease protein hisQ [Brucella intermedia]